MEHAEISYLSLLMVIGIAFLVPIVVGRVRRIFIPVIIGEVIAGVIVGKSGLGLVQEDQVLEILSTLGFIYLMFLSGLEIDFSGVDGGGRRAGVPWHRRLIRNNLFLAAAVFILTLTLSAGAGLFLHYRGLVNDPWIMGLILATTSLGVVVPVLKEKGFTGGDSDFGQLILLSSLLADFASIFLISVYVMIVSGGLTAELLLILVLLAVFAAAYRIALRFQDNPPARRFFDEISSATSQIRVRGSLALALLFIVLATSLGIENILGAFLAGVIVSMLAGDDGSTLRLKLDTVGYGFFIPIFFVMVGVNFDLRALTQSEDALLLVPILTAIAYAVKCLPALIFRVKCPWKDTLAAGFLLSSRLSLLIAAAAIGLNLGAISPAVNSAIILIAIITCVLSPILFNFLAPEAPEARDLILVVGCRKFAELFTRRLWRHDLNAVLICTSGDDQRRKPENGLPAIRAREALSDELRQAGVEKARMVVAMEETDSDNIMICRMARHMFHVPGIISWVQDPSLNRLFRAMGARVVNPAYSTLYIMEGMVLNLDAFSMATDVDEGADIREAKVKSSELDGIRVDDLILPDEVNVLTILRKGDFLVPDTETVLRVNDTVTLVGPGERMERALALFHGKG